LYVPTINSRKQ